MINHKTSVPSWVILSHSGRLSQTLHITSQPRVTINSKAVHNADMDASAVVDNWSDIESEDSGDDFGEDSSESSESSESSVSEDEEDQGGTVDSWKEVIGL